MEIKVMKEMKRDFMYLKNLISDEKEMEKESISSTIINDSIIVISSKIEDYLSKYFKFVNVENGIGIFSYRNNGDINIAIDLSNNIVKHKSDYYIIDRDILVSLFNSDYYNEISTRDIKVEARNHISEIKNHLNGVMKEIKNNLSLIRETKHLLIAMEKFSNYDLEMKEKLEKMITDTRERLFKYINNEFLIEIRDEFIIEISIPCEDFHAEIYLSENYSDDYDNKIVISNTNFRENDLSTIYSSGILFECRKQDTL